MKIAIISLMEGFPWGGSEELWYRVALKAKADGHELVVCVKHWPEEHSKIKELRKNGIRVIPRMKHVPTFTEKVFHKLGFTYHTTNEYLKELNSFRADRILVSQGGTFDLFNNSEYCDFLLKRNKSFQLISQFNVENVNLLLKEEARLRLQKLSTLWSTFYFVSGRNRSVAEQQAQMNLPKTIIVDNPVNISNTDALPWPNDKVLRMACVARYQCSLKGQDALIKTLGDPIFSTRNFKLDFYGQGPDKELMIGLIEQNQLQEKLFVHDHSSNIDELWSTHHVLILPSLAEGTPLVVQECMFKGRPSLTTDVGDCSKLVIPGKTGFLVEKSASEDLKKKLLELIETPMEQLHQLGEQAHQFAMENIRLDTSEMLLANLLKEN